MLSVALKNLSKNEPSTENKEMDKNINDCNNHFTSINVNHPIFDKKYWNLQKKKSKPLYHCY